MAGGASGGSGTAYAASYAAAPRFRAPASASAHGSAWAAGTPAHPRLVAGGSAGFRAGDGGDFGYRSVGRRRRQFREDTPIEEDARVAWSVVCGWQLSKRLGFVLLLILILRFGIGRARMIWRCDGTIRTVLKNGMDYVYDKAAVGTWY